MAARVSTSPKKSPARKAGIQAGRAAPPGAPSVPPGSEKSPARKDDTSPRPSAHGSPKRNAEREHPPEPKTIDGLTQLAIYITQFFQDVVCSKQTIVNWRKEVPPFPAPTSGNRYDWPACKAWVETWRVQQGYAGVTASNEISAMAARLPAERIRSELEEIEHERFLQEKEKGLWIPRAIARHTVMGAVKKYHGFVKAETERGQPEARQKKLLELGATPALCAAFLVWDLEQGRAFTDRLEEQCAAEGRE